MLRLTFVHTVDTAAGEANIELQEFCTALSLRTAFELCSAIKLRPLPADKLELLQNFVVFVRTSVSYSTGEFQVAAPDQ